jgi:SH3-like domain-containing protein
VSSALVCAAAAVVALLHTAVPAQAQEPAAGTVSGLPVPRFVSLKADRVNVRGGPTKDHDVAWIFTRSGLPVEVTAEFDNWRRIRDWEGAEGWVFHSMLSGRRTAITRADPRDKEALLILRAKADAAAAITARLQPGVVGTIKRCTGNWCRFAGAGFDGWIAQERLFGVYPNEKMD